MNKDSHIVGQHCVFCFCKTVRIFAYSSGLGWSETEMGERDWGETLKGRVRLARFARALLHPHKRFARVICTHSV